jgi:twitching motility protein PilT
MAQLDRFLQAMVGNGADSILLIESDLATIQKNGVPQPITKQPLSAAQLLMLLCEIAPADAAAELQDGTPASFAYSNDIGGFVVRTARTGGRWHASIAASEHGALTAAEPTSNGDAETGHTVAGNSVLAGSRRISGGRAKTAPSGARAPGRRTSGGTQAEPTARVSRPSLITWEPLLPNANTDEERNDAALADINHLLCVLVERQGSDLHLRVGEPPLVRHQGEMVRLEGLPMIENDTVEAMLRAIMPARNRQEFADLNDTDFAYEIPGLARFRCNSLRDRRGAGAVFRVIPADVITVEELGISPEVQRLCYLSKGLVLITGPTGSGKTTTLCALLDLVNRERSDHVITIEDPIEFVHENKKCIITQRQVGVHTQSFKSALRAALREDPDIVMVGELRDLETVSIAIETAETGHLVFGTLHTNTASSTIDRVIDQFPAGEQEQIRVMLSESLKGVISQTLCKKIGGGRVAAFEILLSTPAVANLIREGKTFQIPSVIQTSRRLGMISMNDALLELVEGKRVEPRDAYIKAIDKTGFAAQLRARGHDASFVENDLGSSGSVAAQARVEPASSQRPVPHRPPGAKR